MVSETLLSIVFSHLVEMERPLMLLFAKLIESARVSSNTLTSTFSAVEELFCRSRHKSVCISVRFVQKE
jgi:hypothetical protein